MLVDFWTGVQLMLRGVFGVNGFTLIDEEKIKAGVYRVYQTLLTEMGIVGRVLGVFSLECWEKKGLET